MKIDGKNAVRNEVEDYCLFLTKLHILVFQAELEASLPSAKAAATLQNSDAVKTLRQLMDQVRQL